MFEEVHLPAISRRIRKCVGSSSVLQKTLEEGAVPFYSPKKDSFALLFSLFLSACEALGAHSCWGLRKLEIAEPEPVSDLKHLHSVLPAFGMPFTLAEQVG